MMDDSPVKRQLRLQRLRQLQAGFGTFPGRAPGGSGNTGIGYWGRMNLGVSAPHIVAPPSAQDLQEYDQMIQEQQEYRDLAHEFGDTSYPFPSVPRTSGSSSGFLDDLEQVLTAQTGRVQKRQGGY